MCCTADCLQFFFKFVKYFVYMESLSLFCSMFIYLALTTDTSLTLSLFNLLSLFIFLSMPLNSLLTVSSLYLSLPSFPHLLYFPTSLPFLLFLKRRAQGEWYISIIGLNDFSPPFLVEILFNEFKPIVEHMYVIAIFYCPFFQGLFRFVLFIFLF